MKHGGFEPPTTWLKVRCSTDWASAPKPYVVYTKLFLNTTNAQNRNRTSDTRIFSPLLYQLSYLGIRPFGLSSGDRIWTYDLRVMSPTSFQTAPPRVMKLIARRQMDGGGFEPPKQFAADLQSVPFGHSGIHPYGIVIHKADDRTRTDNLLITNQLLCQLSHIGITIPVFHHKWGL